MRGRSSKTGHQLPPDRCFGFIVEPAPQVNVRQIGKAWHVGKVLVELRWLAPPGWKRELYATLMKTRGKAYGIPITI